MRRALKNMLSFERYVDMNNIIDELEIDVKNLKKENIILLRDMHFLESKFNDSVLILSD